MITPMGLLERNPTYKAQLQELGIETPNLGLFQYPVLQTSDIVIYKANYVPVGQDQLPHVWISADIAKTFRFKYGDIFPIPQELVGDYPNVPGIDNRKMSKSYDNSIFIRDDEKNTYEKVKMFYTDPIKIRKDDVGHPAECPVFFFHKMLAKENAAIWLNINEECLIGKRGCVACKKEMADSLNSMLRPIRERRRLFSENPGEVEKILIDGGHRARAEAQDTIRKARKAMGLSEWSSL